MLAIAIGLALGADQREVAAISFTWSLHYIFGWSIKTIQTSMAIF